MRGDMMWQPLCCRKSSRVTKKKRNKIANNGLEGKCLQNGGDTQTVDD